MKTDESPIAPIDELARLKAERDELREALKECTTQLTSVLQLYQAAKREIGQYNGLLDVRVELMPATINTDECLDKARAILAKTERK